MSKARRKFREEFRREAVRLVVEGKKSITSAAKELGVYQSTLGRWLKQGEVDAGRGPAGALTTDEREGLPSSSARSTCRTTRAVAWTACSPEPA